MKNMLNALMTGKKVFKINENLYRVETNAVINESFTLQIFVKKEEDVTVLIPVYNSKDSIKETIESIKKQKYCGDIYINVIDDGSTDGSLELLESMDADSNITLI